MILTPAQLREGSVRARDLAQQETEIHLKRRLADHALALALLAERIERDQAQAAAASGLVAPGEGEAT